MVMETTMTWNLKYFSLRLTIKAFILREFFSIWIVRVAEFLLQKKSWWDKRKLVAGDLTEYIQVGIHRVSWLPRE